MRIYSRARVAMILSWAINPLIFRLVTPYPIVNGLMWTAQFFFSLYLAFKALSIARIAGRANEL